MVYYVWRYTRFFERRHANEASLGARAAARQLGGTGVQRGWGPGSGSLTGKLWGGGRGRPVAGGDWGPFGRLKTRGFFVSG